MTEHENLSPELEEMDTPSEATVAYDDESIIWEGRPSQWVNFGTYLWWAVILIAATTFLVLWTHGLRDGYSSAVDTFACWASYTLCGFALFSIAISYLTVFYEHTVITKNKIKEAKGITSIFRQELFCEISDIRDVKSPPAGVLGLLGLSTLIIETNDEDQPIIKIRAIKDRELLIEKLLPIWRKLKIERKGYFGDR